MLFGFCFFLTTFCDLNRKKKNFVQHLIFFQNAAKLGRVSTGWTIRSIIVAVREQKSWKFHESFSEVLSVWGGGGYVLNKVHQIIIFHLRIISNKSVFVCRCFSIRSKCQTITVDSFLGLRKILFTRSTYSVKTIQIQSPVHRGWLCFSMYSSQYFANSQKKSGVEKGKIQLSIVANCK